MESRGRAHVDQGTIVSEGTVMVGGRPLDVEVTITVEPWVETRRERIESWIFGVVVATVVVSLGIWWAIMAYQR